MLAAWVVQLLLAIGYFGLIAEMEGVKLAKVIQKRHRGDIAGQVPKKEITGMRPRNERGTSACINEQKCVKFGVDVRACFDSSGFLTT